MPHCTGHLLFTSLDDTYEKALDAATKVLSHRYAMDFRRAAERYAALGRPEQVAAKIASSTMPALGTSSSISLAPTRTARGRSPGSPGMRCRCLQISEVSTLGPSDQLGCGAAG